MSSSLVDLFDPNNWSAFFDSEREYRVYLDDRGGEYAIVDEEDYHWAIQWRWNAKRDPNGKVYARRAVDERKNGVKLRTTTVYLHIEIMKRTKKRRKSKHSVLTDHRNGRSLDCRRFNLRWATYQQNNLNRWGRAFYQQSMDI